MPTVENLLGRVTPVISSSSRFKANVPVPSSLELEWATSKTSLYAEYIGEENAILISPYNKDDCFSRSKVHFCCSNKHNNYFSMSSGLLQKLGCFQSDAEATEIEVYRCFDEELLFGAEVKRLRATSTTSFEFYKDFSEKDVSKLAEQFPGINISIKVLKRVNCLLLKACPAS